MDDERLHLPTIDIFESDKGWQRTGLLDQHGNELMSATHTQPIGFVTDFTRPSVVETKPRDRKRR
jgi:hypothetical protein